MERGGLLQGQMNRLAPSPEGSAPAEALPEASVSSAEPFSVGGVSVGGMGEARGLWKRGAQSTWGRVLPEPEARRAERVARCHIVVKRCCVHNFVLQAFRARLQCPPPAFGSSRRSRAHEAWPRQEGTTGGGRASKSDVDVLASGVDLADTSVEEGRAGMKGGAVRY